MTKKTAEILVKKVVEVEAENQNEKKLKKNKKE